MCQVSELLMYIYLMNGLFICYMLWARDVSNILEYKPSEVIDHQQEDRLKIMYSWKEVLPTKGARVWRASVC